MAKIATTVYEQIRTAILTGELSNSEHNYFASGSHKNHWAEKIFSENNW